MIRRILAVVLVALVVTVTTVVPVQAQGPLRSILGGAVAPTLGPCGTSTLATGSNDGAGRITITAGTPTTCQVLFGRVYATSPVCGYTNETTSTASGGPITYQTDPPVPGGTTGFTINRPTFTGAASNFGTDTLGYTCVFFN